MNAYSWHCNGDDPMRVAPPDDIDEPTDVQIADQAASYLRANRRNQTTGCLIAEALVEADGCIDLHDYTGDVLIDGLEGTTPDLCEIGRRVYELCERYVIQCAESNA